MISDCGPAADAAGSRALTWIDALRAAQPMTTPLGYVDVWDALTGVLYVRLLELGRGDAPPPPMRRAPFAARFRSGIVRALATTHVAGVPRERSPFVFMPREPTHVRVQEPVIAALEARGRPVFRFTTHDTTARAFRMKRVPYVHGPWTWRSSIARLRRSGFERQVEHGVDGRVTKLVNDVLVTYAPLVAEIETMVSTLTDQCAPAALIVGNDLTLEGRTASLAAARLGIPTVCIQHGIVTSDPLQRKRVAGRILVFGDQARRTLESMGVDAGRLVVTGDPAPPAPRNSGRTDSRLVRHFALRPDEHWVLVALSGPGHGVSRNHHQRLIAALQRCARATPGVRFLVKLHRKDAAAYYVDGGGSGAGLLLPREDGPPVPHDIEQWLPGCRLLITGASASAVDAMSQGIPVLTIDLTGEIGAVDFIANGGTFHVTDEQELPAAVHRGLSDEQARRATLAVADSLLRDVFHARGPEAAERCADAIEAVAP